MRVGVVTDVHLGLLDSQESKLTLLARIAEKFEQEDVSKVLFLGDLVHETPDRDESTLLKQVRAPFDDFDCYATTGNHDIINLSRSEFEDAFETTSNTVVERKNGTSLVMVDSAAESKHENVGFIDPAGYELIETELESGQDVILATHFPPQQTDLLPQVFQNYPEGAYPVNKLLLEDVVSDVSGNLEHILCGHLHPSRTNRVRGNPLDVPMTVFEPVHEFTSPYGETFESAVNERIDMGELIFEVSELR